MIISGLLEIIFWLLKLIFSVLPALPPVTFLETILTFVNDILAQGIGLLCFFVRPGTLIMGLTLFIVIFTFKYNYGFVMWVMKKIPFFNMK